MRSPKKIRPSRRHLCPISINCELVAAVRGKTCPNRNYCKRLAAPWEFPYDLSILSDGTRVLTVSFFFLSPNRTKYQNAGWYKAQKLPYFYADRPEYNKPVLIVAINPIYHPSEELKKCGWQNAEDLTDNFYMGDWFYKIKSPQSNYPFCILPPDY